MPSIVTTIHTPHILYIKIYYFRSYSIIMFW